MLEWGIGVLVAITVIMLILRFFFKKIFKVVSIIWFLLFLATIAFTIVLYEDARSIKNNFASGDNLFLLESEGDILAGFVTHGENEPELFEGVGEMDKMFSQGNLDGMLESGNYFKMFVINEKSFDSVPEVDLGDVNVSAEEALDVIKSDDPSAEYEEMLARRNMTDKGTDTENDEKIKGLLFGLLFFAGNAEEGPLFLVNNFKEGSIIIHEESIVFKMIKYFPASMMDEVVEQIGKQEEA